MKNKKGFTVLEALAASLILALSLFAVGTAIYSQVIALNENREKAIATLSAQEEVEKIRGLPFNSIASHQYVGFNATDPMCPSGFRYLNSPVCTVTVDNKYDGVNSNSHIKRVSVAVSWASIAGHTLQRELVTLITENGIDKQ